MTPHYIVQGIFVAAGAVALLAAVFNWEWFFTARNTQSVVRSVGRGRARWFYGTVGLLCIGMAIYFFIKTKSALLSL
ncbi:immunity 17 family protein [Bacteroides sp.]|uniref:immunity 17 family protein n=1 Tax=Bacteroides sp. TaxID=29523 RepID=UPI001B6327F4|nr:immunity 17 family protein [Bacteroides sp.]MBP6065843.1 immunity 17 family protein [Bacteroides sp.]MBP6067777.1 immunity 17 family protein [Bacteroides sp.]MBP6937350.1 immunity 17 family protein [Bacteroides sp.]MBP8622155.1 immunity 17 family protein [Bacteroides sp.]MBP9507609.1 immunity 17 family protein [Bacteroides sp.]